MSACCNIWDENWATDQYVAISYSSADSSYPFTNIQDKDRRTKYHRTAGYWNIESGSNTIIFQETSAVNLTATIAVDEYTTTTLFIAALKSALDDAGASTYTVSQDSTTNKIKIASNGSGGGGIFSLIWTHASSSAMAAILGFDTATDMTGALTYTADELKINTSEWIKIDLGMSSNPKAFGIIYDRNKPFPFSPNATLKIQGHEADIWTSPSFEQTIEYNEETIAYINTDGFHTEPLRYWRFLIDDTSNPIGYFEIGFIYLGDLLTTTQGAPQFPLQRSHFDESVVIQAEGAQVLVDQRPKGSKFTVTWQFLNYTEKEDFEFLFQENGLHTPFFISYDSDEVFSSTFQRHVKYVRFQTPPVFILDRPNLFSASIDVIEVL